MTEMIHTPLWIVRDGLCCCGLCLTVYFEEFMITISWEDIVANWVVNCHVPGTLEQINVCVWNGRIHSEQILLWRRGWCHIYVYPLIYKCPYIYNVVHWLRTCKDFRLPQLVLLVIQAVGVPQFVFFDLTLSLWFSKYICYSQIKACLN